jgi:hypothetical protein
VTLCKTVAEYNLKNLFEHAWRVGVIQCVKQNDRQEYIHTYHSRFIPEGVAEVSRLFLRDTHVLPKLLSYEEHCRRDRWQAIWLQSISGVSAINPLVAFYDIHGGKRTVLFFYFVPDPTRDKKIDKSKVA